MINTGRISTLQQTLIRRPVLYLPLAWNANDKSGRNNNGTISGGVTFSADDPCWQGNGGSAVFDGANGTKIQSTSIPDLASSWTVSLWFKRTRTGALEVLYSRWSGNMSSGRQLLIYLLPPSTGSAVDRIAIDVPWVAAVMTSTTKIQDTQWHHLLITRNANAWSLYIDGALNNTATSSAAQESYATTILGTSAENNNFAGSMSGVRLYPYALSAAEISADYAFARMPRIASRIAAYNPAPSFKAAWTRTSARYVGTGVN